MCLVCAVGSPAHYTYSEVSQFPNWLHLWWGTFVFFLESASEKSCSLDLFQQNFCRASVSVDVRAAVNILGLICQIVPLEVLNGSESKSTERTGKHEGGG